MNIAFTLILVWGLWTIELDPATQARESIFQFFYDQNDCFGEARAYASLHANVGAPPCVPMTEAEAQHEAQLTRDTLTEIGIDT